MPIIKSAKKRVRVASKAAARNSKTKRVLKAAIKGFRSKVSSEAYKKAQSAFDISVKKGVIHKNKAARKKRQLAEIAKAAGVKPIAKKSVARKVATKKTIAKKTIPKKTTAKKTTKQ